MERYKIVKKISYFGRPCWRLYQRFLVFWFSGEDWYYYSEKEANEVLDHLRTK